MKQTFKVSGAGRGICRVDFADNKMYWHYDITIGSGNILSKKLKDSGSIPFSQDELKSSLFVPGAVLRIGKQTVLVGDGACILDDATVSGKFHIDTSREYIHIKDAAIKASHFSFKLESV